MDGPAPEEDFSSIPISDRLVHKNWKARVNAYEALVKAFQASASDEDPVFKPYVGNSDLLKKIATDSNVVAQEKGLECLVALLKFAGETAARTRETVVPALVEKAFGSTRAGTKAQATELALLYVEMENAGAGVVVRLPDSSMITNANACAGGYIAWFKCEAAQSDRRMHRCAEGDRTVRDIPRSLRTVADMQTDALVCRLRHPNPS